MRLSGGQCDVGPFQTASETSDRGSGGGMRILREKSIGGAGMLGGRGVAAAGDKGDKGDKGGRKPKLAAYRPWEIRKKGGSPQTAPAP